MLCLLRGTGLNNSSVLKVVSSMQRERDMRMGGATTMNMGGKEFLMITLCGYLRNCQNMIIYFSFLDPYASAAQKFPPLGGGGGIGYEANPGVGQAAMSGSMMGSDMVMYPVMALV